MKITLATIKSFVRKNQDNLYINVKSDFDGMTDMCEPRDGGFTRVEKEEDTFYSERTLGIRGAWFVGSSRDYFKEYNENGFQGYEIYNCCGKFILAVKSSL